MIVSIVAFLFVVVVFVAVAIAYERGHKAGQDDVLRRVVPPLERKAKCVEGFYSVLDTVAHCEEYSELEVKAMARTAITMANKVTP